MKTIRYFLCAIVSMVISSASWASAASSLLSPDGDPPILIRPLPTESNDDPRGPVFNPFTAYLQGNYVILNSSASYGDVDVTLVSTAGDYYITVFDTSDGSILIPISGFAGDYTLLLIDANGAHYVGEFDI